jgi:2-dehydropantoate 2-reductase
MKADAVLVGVQNAMNDAANAAIVGVERTVGCVIELSAEIFDPGVVQRNTVPTGTWLTVGELDGSTTPRIEEIRAILGNVGTCEITDNISGAKWTKLMANSMTCPYSVLGVTNQVALELPGMAEFSAKVGMEAFAVGTALGHRIEPVFGLSAEQLAGGGEQAVVTVLRKLVKDVGGRARTHATQDNLKGRRTEIDFMNGTVVREGERLGIPTPYNRAVTTTARRVSRGELQMDVANLEELQAAVDG